MLMSAYAEKRTSAADAGGTQSGLPASVCDVFSNPSKYDGQFVRLSGDFFSGHNWGFVDNECRLESRITPAICIETSHDPTAPRVSFTTDRGALNLVSTLTRELITRELTKEFRSRAVIEGQLFVAAPNRAGFCSGNQYRVMIVAKRLVSFSLDNAKPMN